MLGAWGERYGTSATGEKSDWSPVCTDMCLSKLAQYKLAQVGTGLICACPSRRMVAGLY